MNVSPHEIGAATSTQTPVSSKLIERALLACAKHHRTATVTVTYRAKRDPESPHIVVLESVAKIKEPKSATTELSGKTDTAELLRLDCGEDEGQERIQP